jgi:iodotyrosine deiodinase
MSEPAFVPYEFERLAPERMLERGRCFYESMDARRSVRDFSSDPVPRELIELAVRTASTAPSGAHQQPWTFVLVGDAGLKREIRIAAEREDGARRKHYYVRESVGTACGIFIAALHTMGLGFLSEILDRPRNEKPFILFPIGYPNPGATVPNLTRKPLEDVLMERPEPSDTNFA